MPLKRASKMTKAGSKAFLIRQAELVAGEMRMDPFEIISRVAVGDVVGLGMMTSAELAFKGIKSKKTGKCTSC